MNGESGPTQHILSTVGGPARSLYNAVAMILGGAQGRMNRFSVDGKMLGNWEAFHDFFANTFGFPGYYGRNMNAWNDCMSDYCYEHGIVSLRIDDASELKARNPEIFDALVECSAFINWRATNEGGAPLIVLSYWV